jgi:hypothetical protein
MLGTLRVAELVCNWAQKRSAAMPAFPPLSMSRLISDIVKTVENNPELRLEHQGASDARCDRSADPSFRLISLDVHTSRTPQSRALASDIG